MTTAESADKTARIVELRRQGLDWRAIGRHVGLSHQACYLRWRAEQGIDERARRKHAEALVERLQAQIEAAQEVVKHARKWQPHDGALAYALRAWEEARHGDV